MAEVASVLVGKVVDILFGAVVKQISYMWNCSQNLEKCKNQADKLTSMKERIQQERKLAVDEGKVPLKGLDVWIKKADDTVSDATKFVNEEADTKKTCFNFKTLHHYGKMATKKTSSLLQLQEDGKIFETCVAHPARTPEFVDLYQSKNLENIDTHKKMLMQIIQAIEDDRVQIVGVCGLGGVGKTTLAGEVAKQMKNQFAEIVFIAISQNIDAKRIKEEVAVAARRIINGEKILIILDDMWEELKLHEVGIPCGSDYINCNILITSRNKAVCEAMEAQKIFPVDPLQPKEAWALFERVVGKTDWGDKWKRVAEKVVEECGGLPLFLEVVGNALKTKELRMWEAALKRLRDPMDKDLLYKKKGIMQLKLSYDNLDSPIAKSCFLVCALFAEDEVISLTELIYSMLVLEVFDNYDSNNWLEDAKSRLQVSIDLLISSSLLLRVEDTVISYNELDEDVFKMHDLVRDMAILITSEGDSKYLVQSGRGLREWQPGKHLESCKKISLMGNKIDKLSDHELLFSHLDTFLAQGNEISFVPDEFFLGMEKLKVLNMGRNNISTLPISLKMLTELHTLDLSRNRSLCDISVLGELKCLTILNLSATGIKNIPKEIGQLNNLRLLDVVGCDDLSYVTPGVISKLIRLEELYIGMVEGDCSFVEEISELKSIKILHLHFSEVDYDSGDDYDFKDMIKADIKDESCSLPVYCESDGHKCQRTVRIDKDSFFQNMSLKKQIQESDTLKLADMKDLDNMVPDVYPTGGSKELRYVCLENCENVTSLVKTSVTSIEVGSVERSCKSFSLVEENELACVGSFCNLRIIYIRGCDSLVELFSLSDVAQGSFCNLRILYIWGCESIVELFSQSVAQGLVNLKSLKIVECKSLEVVISGGGEETNADGGEIQVVVHDTQIVVLPQLTEISLDKLEKLENFFSGHSLTKYPSLNGIMVLWCPSMKRWSCGENHIPNINIEHQGRHYNDINDYVPVAAQEEDGSWKLGDMVWENIYESSYSAYLTIRKKCSVYFAE